MWGCSRRSFELQYWSKFWQCDISSFARHRCNLANYCFSHTALYGYTIQAIVVRLCYLSNIIGNYIKLVVNRGFYLCQKRVSRSKKMWENIYLRCNEYFFHRCHFYSCSFSERHIGNKYNNIIERNFMYVTSNAHNTYVDI